MSKAASKSRHCKQPPPRSYRSPDGERDGGARASKGPQPGTSVSIGVDLSRQKWVYAVFYDGRIQMVVTSPGSLEHLRALVARFGDCQVHVIYEACGFGFQIAWWCQQNGCRVTVVAPICIERAPGPRVKTDRIDARMLASKGANGQLKSIFIPTREQHLTRQYSRTYQQMLEERQRTQIQLRMLLQEHACIGPAPACGWAPFRQWLGTVEFPKQLDFCVKELLQLHDCARSATARSKNALLRLANDPLYRPIVAALTTQRGVGKLSAIRIILELSDIARFRTADSIANYLGYTPSEYSTGEEVHRGEITKHGPGMLRGLILQCAWASISGKRPDPQLREVFDRISQRSTRKRAVIAVARRLALRLRARWREANAKLEAATEELVA